MSTLGATFIKLGQVMSARPDLFPPEMIEELRKLQDRVPAFSTRKAKRIIEDELGEPVNERFTEFDEKPVAAASVAQVHRARLSDGTEVAIKVLRPKVRSRVERDGEEHWVDAGFIVYNEVNYPNFVRLLERLEVATQPTSMSFSVRDDRSGLEYCGTSLDTLFAQRRNLLRPSRVRLTRRESQ